MADMYGHSVAALSDALGIAERAGDTARADDMRRQLAARPEGMPAKDRRAAQKAARGRS